MEVTGQAEKYEWLTAKEIESQAALPTAFRQFWDDRVCEP